MIITAYCSHLSCKARQSRTSVEGLLSLCCPSHVAGLVSDVVIRPVERKTPVRALADFCQDVLLKLSERRPFLAVGDASRSVAFVFGMTWAIAASLHVFPAGIEVVRGPSGRPPMLGERRGYDFRMQATAGLTRSITKAFSSDDLHFTAVADAIPKRALSALVGGTINYNPSSKASVIHNQIVSHGTSVSTLTGEVF